MGTYHVPSSFTCPSDQAVGRWIWKTGNTCNDFNNTGRWKTQSFKRSEYLAAGGSCTQQLDCSLSAYCSNPAYLQYCIQNGAAGYCPEPMCTTTPAASLLERGLKAVKKHT